LSVIDRRNRNDVAMPLSRGLILSSTLMPAIGRFSPAALIIVIGVLPS
jgi:hypothetical protein